MEFKTLCKTCIYCDFPDCGFHPVNDEGEIVTCEEPDEQYCDSHGACLGYRPYVEEIIAAWDELKESHDISAKAKEILWLAMEDYDQLWDRRSPIYERDLLAFAVPLIEWELFAKRYNLSSEIMIDQKKRIVGYIRNKYFGLSLRMSFDRMRDIVDAFMQEETHDALITYVMRRYDYYYKDKVINDVLRVVTEIKQEYLRW